MDRKMMVHIFNEKINYQYFCLKSTFAKFASDIKFEGYVHFASVENLIQSESGVLPEWDFTLSMTLESIRECLQDGQKCWH